MCPGSGEVDVTVGNLSDEAIAEIRRRVIHWGPSYYREFLWRRPGLPIWQGLLAEFLLLRTRAVQVEPVFQRLVDEYPDPASLGRASDADLRQLVSSLGLRWRGELFVRLAREIARREGQLPLDQRELMELPGVGDYVAAATLAFHGGRRAVIVDSNVVRLLCRITGISFDGETRRRRWLRELADRCTPCDEYRAYGYAVLDHSMRVCRPRNPLCHECPVRDLCVAGSGNERLEDETHSRDGGVEVARGDGPEWRVDT